MHTLLRLRPYFRPLWPTILLGLVLMGIYAILSGFSIGLILPIIDKVFVHGGGPAAGDPLPVREGLAATWSALTDALTATGSFPERLTEAKNATLRGLGDMQRQSPPLEVLSWLCGITLIAVLLKNAVEFGRRTTFYYVQQKSAEAIRSDLFDKTMRLPLGTLHRYPSGQLVSRIVTDVELVKEFSVNTAVNFLHHLFQVLVYLGISFMASPKLAMVSFLIVPPIAVITSRLSHKLRKHSGLAQARIAALTSSLTETLGVIRVVKSFGTEPEESRRFAESAKAYRRTVVKLLTIDGIAAPLSEFWGVTIGVLVLYIGGRLVLSDTAEMTPGRFFVFLLALLSMLHPLKQLSGVVTAFQRGIAASARLFEILDLEEETDAPDARPIERMERMIRFENVTFGYDPARPVLSEVSFEAPMGSTTALVGPSGAGKTTLVDLIPRFYDIQQGRILFDDQDIRELRRRDLRTLIASVSQETLLLNETVEANIAYGQKTVDPEAVREAARVANAAEFIDAMPLGYGTQIGERGVLLSGGQRQRLAIARAVLRNPPVLILDEATSALDTESEALVQQALDRLLEGRTTFVIAHRLSTIVRADRILVLDGGRIVQSGTHTELVEQPGLYQRLYRLQFRGQERRHIDAMES